MEQVKKLNKKIISVILVTAMILVMLPITPFAALAASSSENVKSAILDLSGIVADPGTAHTWETMMGSGADGNRYAGRVWVDKSVYINGQTAILNTKGTQGSSFKVALNDDEAFQIIFSALGSSMTTTTSTSSSGPMDVVIILDSSTSMAYESSNNKTRFEYLVNAANELLEDLSDGTDVRISIVTYDYDCMTVLPLAKYENGINLSVDSYSSRDGVLSAHDNDGRLLGRNNGFGSNTNVQVGIDTGFGILANADDTQGRAPVAIVLTDGAANTAVSSYWYDINNRNADIEEIEDNSGIILSTMLNAAYMKARVAEKYGRTPTVYGISIDLDEDAVASAIMNPKSTTEGFNSSNGSSAVRTAYSNYLDWANGENVEFTTGSFLNRINWTFDQLPSSYTVKREDVVNNINYIDTHYNASGAELSGIFDIIYEELTSGVFNPITSSTTVEGETGVKNTPLIYVDDIGQYMEIKSIQAVTLFGNSYSVTDNGDGTYTVSKATGTNPTTNERYDTSEDIIITVTENADKTQRLTIKINQEILPIILAQVTANTVGNTSTSTITEITQNPLRVYYTVGLDSDILLPGGGVDMSKIDSGYEFIDNDKGEVSFYSNAFGVVNPADKNGKVANGDAHVGFKPSYSNRYYYYQEKHEVYSSVTRVDGNKIEWDASEYGVLNEKDSNGNDVYKFTRLSYEDMLGLELEDVVYTTVTYYRPTVSTTDAANNAEIVTYIVYTPWKYIKNSVSFYDRTAKTYISYDANNGYATGDVAYVIDLDKIEPTLEAYFEDNSDADVVVVLGADALRTSRFHNMTSEKNSNVTGSAAPRYVPEYIHGIADKHNGNDVVVWLGNNGKITATIDTGIALTKEVTEAIGNANDTYALTVTVAEGTEADPTVKDENGKDITDTVSSYANNVLTVNVKAGETVYISGIPVNTECTIGENIPENAGYYVYSKTEKVTVPDLEAVFNGSEQYVSATVINAPYKYGNLYITKEIVSEHSVPSSVLAQSFDIEVSVGKSLAGNEYDLKGVSGADKVTVDENGTFTIALKARETAEILGLPEGTNVVVTEKLSDTQDDIFRTDYRTRNHSGADADDDNALIITANANATAVITNTYAPKSVSVDLDIKGTKIFSAEQGADFDGGTFNFVVQKWNGSSWVDIDTKTASSEYAANETGTKNFSIENVLEGITYDHVGSWAYQVKEVIGNVENVTYDRSLYTFTVTVSDNGGQLVATVTDAGGALITDGSYEVTFTNTYHTTAINIDINKEVTNKSGDPDISKAGFIFSVVQTNENWEALENGNRFSAYSDAAGEARIAGVIDEAGTYYLIISEKIPEGAVLVESGEYKDRYFLNGWYYDAREYKITIVVSADPVTGDLSSALEVNGVAQNGDSAALDFNNIYDPKDASLDLDAYVKKALTGKVLADEMFTFYVCENGQSREVLLGSADYVLRGSNKANGTVDFEGQLTFDKIGKYEYDIVEMIPAGALLDTVSGKYVLNGMSYDATIYDLVVEVENNSVTGELDISFYFEDSTDSVVTFNNSYSAKKTSYIIGGVKLLDGRAMRAGEFAFELFEDGNAIDSVSNTASGAFSFDAIEYTSAGVYTYVVKETIPDNALYDQTTNTYTLNGITYDQRTYTVVVTVTDNEGVLSASANIGNSDITFKNSYKAESAKLTFDGDKTLVGGDLEDGVFTFRLYKTDITFNINASKTELVQSVKNENGKFAFDTIEYDQAGTFFYAIIEDAYAGPVSDVVYDKTQHNFIVQVRDEGNGQLVASVEHVNIDAQAGEFASKVRVGVSFVNATFEEVTEKEVYLDGDVTTEIDGNKVQAGDILTYFITYTNYNGEEVTVDISDTIPRYTSYVEGSASHNGISAGDRITWFIDLAPGESVTVNFSVEVDKTDVIVANTAVVRDGVNTYTTNEVINHTVEEAVKKDVFADGDNTTSIDTKKVYIGDTLVYVISYVNASAEKKDITVLDAVPLHTTYVEGSADNGGVYEDGVITWEISDVPAWSTVTVSFKVTVNEGIGAKTIVNEAVVNDGTDHRTNEVSNYTVVDTVDKTVFNANDADANIDGLEVHSGDKLVYEISYTNTSRETVTVVITDNIPEHTTYVEGSVDNGGVYENRTITWTLEVEAGDTVTVSFEVTVDPDLDDVNISNKAQIVEGKNTYTTNEVKTSVPPTPPQTGDDGRLVLWLSVMLISVGAVLTLSAYSRRRRIIEQ